MTLTDPQVVPCDYSSEAGLEARRAAYEHAEGPNASELLFRAIGERRPWRYLEVGCGPGEMAARVRDELGAEVVVLDLSPRMVELARGRGLEAHVGDVQKLPFQDAAFDCAVAAWMLYHVADVPRALSELARVLRAGGRLVAVTNGLDHLSELRELLGLPPRAPTTFSRQNGERLLREHFAHVATIDAAGELVFPNRDAALAYVRASRSFLGDPERLPDFEGPLTVRRSPVIFVAEA